MMQFKKTLLLLYILLAVGTVANAASVNIRGRVVDQADEPVIAASVKVAGTSVGTVTNTDGNYKLSIAQQDTIVIVFSCILKVDRIINEPSAAALACQNIIQEEDALLLVFDFGGGTLDVSLVECFDNVIEIRAVSGDNQLGGQDFDDMIGTHFIRSMEISTEDLTPETKAIIRKSAEKCKRDLTKAKTAEMVVNCRDLNKKMEISRKDVVSICAPLFERMGKPISKVLMDAGVGSGQINRVVLVGGSCKMPVVQQYIGHLLRRNDVEAMEPDHMIALGCGVCAGIKERDEEIKDMLLTDICPFSLGTDIMNHQNPSKPLMSFIIERNTALPVSRECLYTNAFDNQPEVKIRIYQGEAMYAEDNLQLGELSVALPRLPKGEVKCFVRFTYDINGVLEVEVRIPQTGEKRRLVIVDEGLGMSAEEVDKKLKELEKIKVNPADEEENRFILEWGDRLFKQTNNERIRAELSGKLQYFYYIMEKEPYHLPKVRKYITVYLASIEEILTRYISFTEDVLLDGSWYQEDDEEEKEVDNLFKERKVLA